MPNRSPARVVLALLIATVTVAMTPFGVSPAHADDPWSGEPSGQVLDSVTGRPVSGVHLVITDETGDLTHPLTSATTDATGHYRADHLDRDEIGVHVDGSDVGYETGWVGCSGAVVATFGEACTTAPSSVLEIRLDRLPVIVLPDWRDRLPQPPPVPPIPVPYPNFAR